MFGGLQCLGLAFFLAALAAAGPEAGLDVERRLQAMMASRPAILLGAALTSLTFALVSLVAGLLAAEGPVVRLRLGKGRTRAAALPLMVLALLALGQAGDSAIALLGWAGRGSLGMMARAMHEVSGAWLLAAVVVLGGMAGLGEELFFRGFMQTRLRQRLGAWPAILVTALLFGLVHVDPWHSPLALMMGVFLGWITELSGSLRPAVAVHAANNSAWVLLVAWLPLSWPRAVHLWLLAGTLVLGAALLAALRALHPGGTAQAAPIEPPAS